jgi:site-specific recombinase XerC
VDSLTDVATVTRDYYELISRRWLVDFSSGLTTKSIAAHARARLGDVRGKTVRNELSVLRKFLGWASETGRLRTIPDVPVVRASVGGTKYTHRRRVRAPELPPEDVERLLAALPERSAQGWVVRDRLIVAYETALRPATLDKLRSPDNYSRGRALLTLTDDDDKERYGRDVPLTPRAREALDRCCPSEGLIFGRHRVVYYLRKAALALGLPRELIPQHLRSAGITRMLEASGNLPGTQRLAGHKLAATTSGYSRASFRAAQDVVQALSGEGPAKRPPNGSKTSK